MSVLPRRPVPTCGTIHASEIRPTHPAQIALRRRLEGRSAEDLMALERQILLYDRGEAAPEDVIALLRDAENLLARSEDRRRPTLDLINEGANA